MKEKIYKNLLAAFVIMLIMAPAFALVLPVQAQGPDELLWGNQEENVDEALGLGNEDPRVIISRVINVALGFLGIIAVVIIILGGFKWMTAGGNDDKVAESKKLIFAGIVGLVIILAAWGLAKFVIGALYNATGANNV
ncbi:MAG: pilin [Patescibacteria group bacterium]|nr:pilin [Patescibacteria group bacterium]